MNHFNGRDDSDLGEWAKQICSRVGNKWKTTREKYPELDLLAAGWSVFYSPIRIYPALMIIGINPGGEKNDFTEECLPANHSYLTHNYPLAKKMKCLFEDMGHLQLLGESVKLNLLFFRSRSVTSRQPEDQRCWKTLPRPLRMELEVFCSDIVLEIISKLKPRIVLAEGISTYTNLKKRCFQDQSDDQKIVPSTRTIYVRKQTPALTLIGILHPTGARPSTQQMETIKTHLFSDIEEGLKDVSL